MWTSGFFTKIMTYAGWLSDRVACGSLLYGMQCPVTGTYLLPNTSRLSLSYPGMIPQSIYRSRGVDLVTSSVLHLLLYQRSPRCWANPFSKDLPFLPFPKPSGSYSSGPQPDLRRRYNLISSLEVCSTIYQGSAASLGSLA